jgi:Mrp family chromosome partitioning ATPase
MHDNSGGGLQALPVRVIHQDGEDRQSGETHKPNLTLYRSEAAQVQPISGAWRMPDIEVWPVDRPAHKDARLSILLEPESAQAKAYRVLRHRLLAADNPRVVAVTSAKPAEGKTACALNLALAMAEEVTSRVLFIEANARRPALGRLFDFMPPHCFLDQLTALTSSAGQWTVVEVMDTKLHLLALNPHLRQGSIDRVLFAAAIRQLRRVYDYIVIDTPSVLESADVNAVCEAVDGVVFTARAKRSSRTALRRAMDQLSPAPVLGVALLDARREAKV